MHCACLEAEERPDAQLPRTDLNSRLLPQAHRACNCIKSGYLAANALVLMVALADTTLQSSRTSATPTRQSLKLLSGRNDRQASPCEANGHSAKRSKLLRFKTFEEFKDALRPFCLPGGYYRDPSGAILPLTIAEIDKLDPNGFYEPGNVRLLVHGLNYIKKDRRDDTVLFEVITGLKERFDVTRVAQLGAVGLPGA